MHPKLLQGRQLSLSLALRQAIEILQMPQQELALWLQGEIEKNPLLELPNLSGGQTFEDVADSPSLYSYLCEQVRETFLDPAEQKGAEIIVGFLDEKGFFSSSLEEVKELCDLPLEKLEKILQKIQEFDPPGIAARNLQECLLLQLKRRFPTSCHARHIVELHFEDFLHGRFCQIKKKLQISTQELTAAIEILSHLTLRPATALSELAAPSRLADVKAIKMEDKWAIEIVDEEFPPIQIRQDLALLIEKLAADEKKSVKAWLVGAKWLRRSLSRRNHLLLMLTKHLLEKQTAYLEHKGPLREITAQDLAALVGVHESTIHRTLAEKLLEGPWGLIPLRSLLTQPALASHHKQILQRLIEQENKANPLTDEELSELLKLKGIALARRTVAKYRKQLKLGSAARRKQS